MVDLFESLSSVGPGGGPVRISALSSPQNLGQSPFQTVVSTMSFKKMTFKQTGSFPVPGTSGIGKFPGEVPGTPWKIAVGKLHYDSKLRAN